MTSPRSTAWLKALSSWWVVRSLSVGAVATTTDYLLVTLLAYGLATPAPLATTAGLSVGATIAFFGNRRFAFRAHEEPLAPQALRFVLAMGSIIGLHGLAVWVLTSRFQVPVLAAKLVCDVTILAAGQLLVLRRFVFPERLAMEPDPAD